MQKEGLLGARRDKNSSSCSTSARCSLNPCSSSRQKHICSWRNRLYGAAPEVLCIAGHLSVQMSQQKGQPDGGPPCERCQQKTNKYRTQSRSCSVCSSIVSYILFSISCLSFPSIKLFGKAFHNHKSFQFSIFFLYISIIYSQKVL